MLWEVSVWPNNQPPILVGEYEAKNKWDARALACKEFRLSIDDENIIVALAGAKSPINRWKQP